jgi:hypothetical protein
MDTRRDEAPMPRHGVPATLDDDIDDILGTDHREHSSEESPPPDFGI